jgi:hypothetical protein
MTRKDGVSRASAAGAEPGLKDVRRLRGPAAGAAFLLCLLLVCYWVSGLEVVGPPPRRQDLILVVGAVERMRIDEDEHGCFNLSIRVRTERGFVRAANTDLCRAIRRVEPLPAGAPVMLLVERGGSGNVVWEVMSEGRRLIPYEQMHARRAIQRRGHHSAWPLVALLCLPFASFIAFWLWMELQGLVRRGR